MPPIPCAHCGNNFMRPTIDPEAPQLCNNCSVREEKRNPQNKAKMETTVDILIKCPQKVQFEIEELCINQGIDFSRYFLELHYGSQSAIEAMEEYKATPEYKETIRLKIDGTSPVKDAYFKVEEVKTDNNKGVKKPSKK